MPSVLRTAVIAAALAAGCVPSEARQLCGVTHDGAFRCEERGPVPAAACAGDPGMEGNRWMSVDLNGDGVKESVLLMEEESRSYLYVNRLRVSTVERSGSLVRALFTKENGPVPYRVMDIDRSDAFRELAVDVPMGAAGRPVTRFYYFNGTFVVPMGEIPRYPGDGLHSDGAGIVHADRPSAVYPAMLVPVSYRLTKHRMLEESPARFFKVRHDVSVLRQVSLRRSRESEDIVADLRPGERVTVVGTDDRGWMEIRTSRSRLGWLALDENRSIRGTGLRPVDVFESR